MKNKNKLNMNIKKALPCIWKIIRLLVRLLQTDEIPIQGESELKSSRFETNKYCFWTHVKEWMNRWSRATKSLKMKYFFIKKRNLQLFPLHFLHCLLFNQLSSYFNITKKNAQNLIYTKYIASL